jgi:RNA polymerase sigma-70 factor (ECF subfamily)
MSLAEGPERSEDDRLIAAVGLGDESALAALYDRHAGAMLGVAYRVLRHRTDAEDLVHDVFVEAWQKARDFEPSRGSLRTWLLMRVRSRGIDRLRSLEAARRHALASAREESGAATAALPPAWDGSDRARACAALEALPAEQRALIELAYFEGLTCTEMAERCGIPLGTVKSRIAAGMAKLRQSLLPREGVA